MEPGRQRILPLSCKYRFKRSGRSSACCWIGNWCVSVQNRHLLRRKRLIDKPMKVIYNTCFVDPWLKVAKELKEKYGFEPVYWIGYEIDNSENLVPAAFPSAIYHPIFDAWKGIFPDLISKHYAKFTY